MDILDILSELGIEAEYKASTNGGEYCSPCPFCKDGMDRFLLWPKRDNKSGGFKGGRYACRVCGVYGDAIGLLMKLQGLSYREACAKLNVQPQPRLTGTSRKEPKFIAAQLPPDQWQDKAIAFTEWAHMQLMTAPDTLAQLMAERGFTMQAIRAFKLGYCPDDMRRPRDQWGLPSQQDKDGNNKQLWLPAGITIPAFGEDGRVVKIKVRRVKYEQEIADYETQVTAGQTPNWRPQKYVIVSGSMEAPSVYGDISLPCALIMESELDALIAQQIMGDHCFAIGTGGSSKPLDAGTYELLRRKYLVALPDYDQGGLTFWRRWHEIFPTIKRVFFPGQKSLGDAHANNGFNCRNHLTTELKKLNILT